MNKAVGAALTAAVGAVFALMTVGGHDAHVKLATAYFSWAVVFLVGYFAVNMAVSNANDSDRRLLRWVKVGCLILGGVCWQQGAITVVEYVGVSPTQVTLMHAVFALLITLAAVSMIGGKKP